MSIIRSSITALPPSLYPMNATLAVVVSLFLSGGCPQLATADEKIDSLIKIIEDSDKSAQTRLKAIQELGTFKQKAEPAVPTLTKCLKSNELQKAACQTLGNIGRGAKSAIPELIEVMEDRKGVNAIDALAAMDKIGPEPSEFVPAAIRWLKKPAVQNSGSIRWYQTRTAIIQSLGKFGPDSKDAVPVLIAIAASEKRMVGSGPRAAIITLGKIGAGAESALPVLRELLGSAAYGMDAEAAIAQIKKALDNK